MQRLGRYWPFAFFFLLPLLPLWRAVFLGEAIGPFDQVRQMAPWNGPTPSQPWDVLQVDGVLQFYPWRDLVFDAYRHGHLPLWNPYELAGAPLLANSQSGGFYPPHVLVGILRIPTASGITLLAWFHLAWAGLGVFLLARRLGAGRLGAAVGGASFTLSPFMLAWTALASVIETVSWIPWAFAGLIWLSQKSSLRPFALTTFSVAMLLLAGHLQFAAYGLLGLAFLAAWLVIERKSLRLAGGALGALALGALIAAPQLIPVLDYGKFSHRRTDATEAGYEAYVASALKPFELATLGAPLALGNPRAWAEGNNGKAPEYWPQFVKPGANFAESAVSVGPLVFVLLFLAPWKRRELWPVAALGGLALLLALGTVLNKLLYFGVPGWAATGSPARVEVLFVLAACVLTAMSFCEPPGESKTKPLLAAGLLGGLILAVTLPRSASFADVFARLQFAQPVSIANELPYVLLDSVIAGVAAWVLIRRAEPKIWRSLLFAPILIALPFAITLVPTGKPLDPVPGPKFERIAVINSHWGLYGPPKDGLLPPNTASLSRIHELGGYDSLLHKDTVDILKQVDRQDPAPPENGNMMLVKPGADPVTLENIGVSETWSYGSEELSKRSSHSGHRALLYRSIFTREAKAAEITEESTEHLVVKASGPGLLFVFDRNMPGWNVTIDDKPAQLNGAPWREVDLPAGDHSIRFRYSPRGVTLWPLSLLLFIATLVGILVPITKRTGT